MKFALDDLLDRARTEFEKFNPQAMELNWCVTVYFVLSKPKCGLDFRSNITLLAHESASKWSSLYAIAVNKGQKTVQDLYEHFLHQRLGSPQNLTASRLIEVRFAYQKELVVSL